MSSFKSLLRPATQWVIPRRSIHSTRVFRNAVAEPETEAAAARK